MKAIIAAAVLGLFTATAAYAQDPTPEQNRMRDCNALANQKKVMKPKDRESFLSRCMKGEPEKKAAAEKKATTAQQDKMKSCNKQASDKKLKGDERKKFVNQCLKK
jgi:hypothetical protein